MVEKRQEVRLIPSTCSRAMPRLVVPTNTRWRDKEAENLCIQPVYAILLGWSLTPHPGLTVLQQESGTAWSGEEECQGLSDQSE